MPTVVSLFSGAGGLDLGFIQEGCTIVFANDIMPEAVATYRANIGNHIESGDLQNKKNILKQHIDSDMVIGGPPCQGFSVAGKMNPDDERSGMIWEFAKAVDFIRPKVFAMENVKALGVLKKWASIKNKLLKYFNNIGYAVDYVIVNASDHGVPQARERVIFIGSRLHSSLPDISCLFQSIRKPGLNVRDALSILDRAGEGNNYSLCKAKVTLAGNPILRKSPYAGMLFNGLGRPVRIDGYCATLPASMGGNKTPIIDSDELYLRSKSWVESYHAELLNGKKAVSGDAPKRLRRLTVQEAAILQNFPINYHFCGSQSSKFTQIGNAVPPGLSRAIARVLLMLLDDTSYCIRSQSQRLWLMEGTSDGY